MLRHLALVGLCACDSPAPAHDVPAKTPPPPIDPATVSCGQLTDTRDDAGVLLGIPPRGDVPSIEVLDPLSPPSRDLERRLVAAGLDARLDRRLVLMPLVATCNWFVTESVHPGACTVSQAILCADAGGTTRRVLDWAFEQRDAIVEASKADPTAAQRMIGERFPELAACIDTPAVKQRLNRGLRWVAARNLNTVVPQLYIAGTLLCPEANDEAALAGAVTALLSR